MFEFQCHSHADQTLPKLPAPHEELNKPDLKKETITKLVLNGTLVDGILSLTENFHVSEEFNYATRNKLNLPATEKTVPL